MELIQFLVWENGAGLASNPTRDTQKRAGEWPAGPCAAEAESEHPLAFELSANSWCA
jgi:hypothetical protein